MKNGQLIGVIWLVFGDGKYNITKIVNLEKGFI